MRRAIVVAIALLVFSACRAEHPTVAWNAQAGTIDVTGLRDPDDAKVAVRSGPADAPPMLGRISVERDRVVFHPRFPLVPGLSYRVRVNDIEQTITIPKVAAAAVTHVAQIFPTSNEIPANQLKFYIDFSAPMSVGDVYRHIQLLDENGHEVQRAFLQTAHELWDSRRRRFTLILDPGRIKRGLRANLESGAPLREGGRYRLVIDDAWRDGDGNPLRETFTKSFLVVAADRTMPNPQAWRVIAPAAGSTDPLRLHFDEPLDRALLDDIAVPDVEGAIEIADGETAWIFRPKQPWREGEFAVHVPTRIEDRAGNTLQRLFDEDASVPSRDTATLDFVEMPFTTRRPSS